MQSDWSNPTRILASPQDAQRQSSLTSAQPLLTKIYPSGELDVVAGAIKTKQLRVVIINQGDQSALIDVSVDQSSETVKNWFKNTHQRLALTSGQSSEVVFEIKVPANVIPNYYDYLLTIDAPDHYPEETPILHPGKILVNPFVQEAKDLDEPSFSIQPSSSSAQPLPVQWGQTLELSVKVRNLSERVDRFRVTCLDLDPDWYKVIYPENLQTLGLAVTTDALELNPNEDGNITVLVTPPATVRTIAQIYKPTFRLYSENNPDLVLLDLVYFQVADVYDLTAELITRVSKVKKEPGLFELRLENKGNTRRSLTIKVESSDGEPGCNYTLQSDKLIEYDVYNQARKYSSPTVPLVPEINRATTAPTPFPEPIVNLLPGEKASITLTMQPPAASWRRPFYGKLFSFNVEISDRNEKPLVNDRFPGVLLWEARPWWHLWLLGLFSIGSIATIALLIWATFFRAKPEAKIAEFTPESATYQALNDDMIRLTWQITQPKHLQSISIVGSTPDGTILSEPVSYDFSKGIPSELQDFCVVKKVLICKSVPTDARQAGDYIFEMKIIAKEGQSNKVSSLQTKIVKITPIPLPQILALTPTQPIYQEQIATAIKPQKPNLAVNLLGNNSQNSPPPPQPGNLSNQQGRVFVNWEIINFAQIGQLQLVGRSPEGVALTTVQNFDFAQGFPPELSSLCKIASYTRLVCNNVPTTATTAGTYIFELKVIPRRGNPLQPILKLSEGVIIKAPSPKITSFKIQGVEAQPKYRVQVDPKKPIILKLAWEVQGGKNLKVELLPSPGTVSPQGAIAYPLSQEPKTETITLQATNEAGEQVNRAVVIETFIVPPPEVATNSTEAGTVKIPKPPSVPVLEGSGNIPQPPTLPGDTAPEATTGDTASEAAAQATPSKVTTKPSLPQPQGASPPLSPQRQQQGDALPPMELPPQFN